MIDVSCSCGKTYRVPDDKAGRKLQCRRCGSIQRIPQRSKQGSDPLLVPFQMLGVSEDDDGLRAPTELPLDLRAPLRRCPSCGTQDDPGVVICVRCGYDFRAKRRLSDPHEEEVRDSQRQTREEGARELEQLTRAAWTALSPLGVALGPFVFARSLKVERSLRAHGAPRAAIRQAQQARLLGLVGLLAWLLVFIGVAAYARKAGKGSGDEAHACRSRLEAVGRAVRERALKAAYPPGGRFPEALEALTEGADASLGPDALSCPVDGGLYTYKRRDREVLTGDTPADYLILWDDPAYPHADGRGALGFRALRFDGTVETFRTRGKLEAALERIAFSQVAAVGRETRRGGGTTLPSGGGLGSAAEQASMFLSFADECDEDDPELTQFVDTEFFLGKVGVPPDALLPVLLQPTASDRLREAAARMLARVELRAPLRLELATEAAGDESVGVRLGAGLALKKLGNKNWIEVLGEVVEHGEPETAIVAQRVLGRAAIESAAATRAILDLARRTRERIGAKGDDAMIPIPSAALVHVVPLLTDQALGREAEAVFYSADADGVEHLHASVSSPDEKVRRVALRCFQRLRRKGIVSTVEYLDLLTAEPDLTLRAEAIKPLSLEREHPERAVADWALAALRSGQEALIPPCKRIVARVGLPDAYPPSKHEEGLGWLLDDLGREGELRPLVEELGAPTRLLDERLDEQLRSRWKTFAIQARRGLLRNVTARLTPTSPEILLVAATDPDAEVRNQALSGLVRTGAPQSERFRKAVGRMLSSRLRDETEAKARESIFRLAKGTRYCGVGEAGQDHRCDRALFSVLKALASDGDRRALRALATHPSDKVVSFLQDMLEGDGEKYLRLDVAEALRTMTGLGLMTPDPDLWRRDLQEASGRVRMGLRKAVAKQRRAHAEADERAAQRLKALKQSR